MCQATILHTKNCYTNILLCSICPKLRSKLHRYTRQIIPWDIYWFTFTAGKTGRVEWRGLQGICTVNREPVCDARMWEVPVLTAWVLHHQPYITYTPRVCAPYTHICTHSYTHVGQYILVQVWIIMEIRKLNVVIIRQRVAFMMCQGASQRWCWNGARVERGQFGHIITCNFNPPTCGIKPADPR